jgi:hypothetical protein
MKPYQSSEVFHSSSKCNTFFAPKRLHRYQIRIVTHPISHLSTPVPFSSSIIIPYNAATNAAATPINPPTPATIAGAAFALTEAGALELELATEADALLDFALPLEALLLVEGALVVAATEVVTAVTLVVETGTEDLVVITADEEEAGEEVVVAEAEATEAEYAEQRPKPTEAATARSLWLQAERRQGATAAWMAENPEPHWQPWSASWQPATEIAEVRHGICWHCMC